ncbi:GNAT superfamily N-acetyltransferase [Arthrobacter stackebrandtii]|uniref:GNAT superfamily N-acetyltransferase n=1 Tax=Arthrobacter stackebrandtii TaxID=272161 RepID=A0ABS4YRI8_9MICC|nr:GNAT family N-acetyltransferase [Arthrobacter stackebrandtii]MBP2411411.1 GNAT superfamily N-acetyltransferase [Arthrobacter stackebrandtii]
MHSNKSAGPPVRLCTAGDMPTADQVEALYAAASGPPPLSEPAGVAAIFAGLYGSNRDRPDVVAAAAHLDGELVGFAYGHPWHWGREDDPWSQLLRDRLGDDAAALIENSFSVVLLAVHPDAGRRGVGAGLLEALMVGSGSRTHWLQTTDIDSPARRLYLRHGYEELGHGPDAPNWKPGLVLIHTGA